MERRQRKNLGAFYSPAFLVAPMVSWAITRADQSVLDPACGDGVFLEGAARRLRHLGATSLQTAALLHGADLNPQAIAVTGELLCELLGRTPVDLKPASFFSLPPPGSLFGESRGVDVVIGNPPYIRYQQFAGKLRAQALGCAADAGVQLTRLASSWAHFAAHAVSFLEPRGRLALILPAELIHTSYAEPLRRHLRRSFREVHVVSFRRAVFPGVQAEVVLLLAEGKGEGPGRLGIVEVEDGRDLDELGPVLARAETFPAGAEPEKWLPGHAAHAGARGLENLCAAGLFHPLASVGKAGIGFVSGANDFFVLTPEEAARWRLPAASLRAALVRARQAPGLEVSPRDVALLREHGERCLLWLPRKRLTRAERAYILHGEELGIDGRYKCRVRTPWYRVPGVAVPHAFLTYMIDAVPRLCLNRARAVASNNLLAVRLPGVPARLRRAFVAAFYNSATLLSCERTGRSYGGGVLKLEPSEADRILVPSLELVARHRAALVELAPLVDAKLREGKEESLREAISEVDALLLAESEAAGREMAELRTRLLARRRTRARRNPA